MLKKAIVIFCVLLITVTGCTKKEKKNSIDEIITKNNYIVVDVRTKEEYDESHVVNSLNIPYDEIDENIDLDKTKTILVYCRSGNRSGIAYKSLTALGYEVVDLGSYASVKLEKTN